MIPVAKPTVRVDLLHPELVARLERMFADPAFDGWSLISAGRTYGEQAYLRRCFDCQCCNNGNLAAHPDSPIGTTPGGTTFTGSYHMVQSDGFAHAVDLRAPRRIGLLTTTQKRRHVDREAPRFGLRRTVPSEWWHLQAFTVRQGWFHDPSAPPAPPPPPPPPPALAATLASMLIRFGFFTYLNEGRRYRYLGEPTSVAAFRAAKVPEVDLSASEPTFLALRREAIADGAWDGEPADVAALLDDKDPHR